MSRRPTVPSTLVGFPQARKWLRSIGIQISETALGDTSSANEWKIARRGQVHVFRPKDLRLMVQHLSMYPYEEYIDRWVASGQQSLLVWRGAPWPKLCARPLKITAALARVNGALQVARTVKGDAYVSSVEVTVKAWPMVLREYIEKIIEYRGSRILRPGDLSEDLDALPESALVVVSRVDEGKLLEVRVSGKAFGLEPQVRTRLVAPRTWGGWKLWKPKVDRVYPAAIWVLWHRAVEIDRFGSKPVVLPEWRTETPTEPPAGTLPL